MQNQFDLWQAQQKLYIDKIQEFGFIQATVLRSYEQLQESLALLKILAICSF
ncbi:hypothetical protein GF406_23620 [candidate division KSB1 bacterium]|nr:hypothetical protein [candidate division KSB1 bacterium]